MKIIEYNNKSDMWIEFQDKYKAQVHSSFQSFQDGAIRNPYYPNVCGVGIIGNKYPSRLNGECVKEYISWHSMLQRCFNNEYKELFPTYKDVTCCKEWLLYENFYEWLHCQENFDKWYNYDGFCLDKDILLKGNKIYSPDTCCLVPQFINKLFTKSNKTRGNLPIGVGYSKRANRYKAYISIIKNNKRSARFCGHYPTPEDAFYLGYKPEKEKLIKQIAQEEYNKDNITKRCYDAMMNYKVEITD